MKHATSRTVFTYWDSLRGERAAPERGEIEPGELRHVLADTFILELGPARVAEIRLAGTRLCAFFGRELKGLPFQLLWQGEAARDVAHLIDVVVEETAGVVAGLRGKTDEDDSLDFEMILLPLRYRGQTHSRLLGAISPAAVPHWIGLHPLAAFETTSMRVIWPSRRTTEAAPDIASTVIGVEALKRRRHLVVHPGGRS